MTGDQDERGRVRNSMLSNGFHLPSILLLFSLMAPLCDAKISFMLDPQQEALRARTANTLWGGDWLYNAPGLLTVNDVVTDMGLQLQALSIPSSVWQECRQTLSHCDIVLPQAFSCFQRSRGRDWSHCPPRPLLARDRTQILASNSGQRYSSEESRGLDFLLPPGLGKSGHVIALSELSSPFSAKRWPDDDVFFVAYTVAVWQDGLPLLAAHQRHCLKCISRALTPLRQWLCGARCDSAQRVAASKDVAFLACMTALLRWPDREQAISFIEGFPIVGEIPRTGIFREILLRRLPMCRSGWGLMLRGESMTSLFSGASTSCVGDLGGH